MGEFILNVFQTVSHETSKKITEFRANSPDIEGKIRTLEEEKRHLEKYCSDDDIKAWIIVFEGEEIVGVTAIYGRKVQYAGKNVWLGGIGKVRVRKDMRKMGIANMMMDEAIKQLKQLNFDVAFLTTDLESFLRDYYERYGFVTLNKNYTFFGSSGKEYSDNNGMLAPISSKTIFQQIIASKEPFHIGKGNW